MKYDFDEITERRGTQSFKYDFAAEYFGTDKLIPMWVADMDFRTPDFIMEAIRSQLAKTAQPLRHRGPGGPQSASDLQVVYARGRRQNDLRAKCQVMPSRARTRPLVEQRTGRFTQLDRVPSFR